MPIRSHVPALVVVVAVFSSALAGVPPPEGPFGDSISWPQISKIPPATDLAMGPFKVQFEKTTLGAIVAASGRGEISHQGDAGSSIYWLCYTVPHQRLWIVSDGEMGGPEHAVTQLAAQQSNRAPTVECPELPAKLRPISLHGGIWLGTSQNAVIKTLGPASHSEGRWQSFNYEGKVAGGCAPDGYDLLNWVLIKSERGRVVGIRAGQVTSC